MRTHVYIDGFNFYYGCVKGTPFRWLDFGAFCKKMLPSNDVKCIKYFTALVDDRNGDVDRPMRQQAYLRALRTIGGFEIYLGQFMTKPVTLPRADGKGTCRVLRTEEKGSDVNLAAHMLNDAHRGLIDCAVVVSNDSDLVEPIRMVRQDLKLPVGVLAPTSNPNRYLSVELRKQATFVKQIRQGVLRASLLPNPVVDARGSIAKPAVW